MSDLPDPMHLTDLLIEWLEKSHEQHADEQPKGSATASEVVEAGEPVAADPEVGIDTVSAWAGTGALREPAQYVAFAKGLGLKRLDVIVNDHAADRAPRDFDTYHLDSIRKLAAAATGAGLELHYMSWLMPHAKYIDGAAKILLPLVAQTGAKSIMFDCEEPWTQAHQPMDYGAAANLVRERFGETAIGVTGIGYASATKLGPICALADYLVPQCYSTSSSGISPATVVPRLTRHWRQAFKRDDLVIGLAAYRQSGIPGYTPEAALRTAFGGAQADPKARTVIYWSLAQIRSDRHVAATIAALAHGT